MAFASKLSAAQMNLARAFERAKLCTISQAVKAFERHDDEKIENWKKLLRAQREQGDTPSETRR